MLWTWLVAQALGAGFYLESSSVETRAEVVVLRQQVEAVGHVATVVRRFVDGQGWRFLVRVDGLEGKAAAEAAAASIADAVGSGVDILELDGDRRRFVRHHDPGQPALPAEPAPGEANTGAAWAILERASAAHGIDRDTLTRWMAGPSHLEYRRTLGDGTVVDHGWWTRDSATYVTVRAVQGEAASSRVFVCPEKAWLAIGGQAWEPQSSERAAVVVADLGPAAVIPVVLGLRQAMETRPEFAAMEYLGERGGADGKSVHVLGYGGDKERPAMVLEITKDQALIHRVSFGGGELTHEFGDYRPVGTATLPHRVRSERPGGVVDVVEIAVLRTGDEALDDRFVVTGNATSPPP